MTHARILSAIIRKQPTVDAGADSQRELWRKFGQSIRDARRRLRFPLKTFARDLGYTPSMVAMLETGKREWTIEKAKLASEVLK